MSKPRMSMNEHRAGAIHTEVRHMQAQAECLQLETECVFVLPSIADHAAVQMSQQTTARPDLPPEALLLLLVLLLLLLLHYHLLPILHSQLQQVRLHTMLTPGAAAAAGVGAAAATFQEFAVIRALVLQIIS